MWWCTVSCDLVAKDIAPIAARLSVCIETPHDLAVALRFGVRSVIVAPQEVSLSGTLALETACQLIDNACAAPLECQLLLDFLPFDNDFPRTLEVVQRCVEAGVTFVRVQNIGLALELRRRFPQLRVLHEIKSGGNHRGYYREMEQVGFCGALVSRELHWEAIGALASCVSEAFLLQIQLFGRVQIFHSARDLVSTVSDDASVMLQETTRPDERFALHKAGAGTVLYHSHIMDLVPHVPALLRDEVPFSFLVDHRGVAPLEAVLGYVTGAAECPAMLSWKRSDFQFMVQAYSATEEDVSGDVMMANASVVAISRNEYVIAEVATVLRRGECYTVKTPEQKVFRATLSEIRTWWGETLDQAERGEFVRLHWFKGATVGARLTATEGASG